SASAANASLIADNNGRMVWSAERSSNIHVAVHKKHQKKYVKKKNKKGIDANGNVATLPWNMVRVKTVQGFYITVHPAYAHKFLKLFEILEENHIKVPKEIVGCFSRGGHVRGSNHYIGAACDIQTGWNRTIPA